MYQKALELHNQLLLYLTRVQIQIFQVESTFNVQMMLLVQILLTKAPIAHCVHITL